jgi:hypothetical protein
MTQRLFCRGNAGAPPSWSRRYLPLAFGVGLALGGLGILPAHAQQTVVSIQQERFLVNGVVTHKGTAAEGLLLNSRMIQAIFDDENPQTVGKSAYPDTGIWDAERNVQEFIAALPSYKSKGLKAFTVGLQGGSPGWATGNNQPGIITGFRSDGSLKWAWMDRLDRVIRAADQHGMVVIVSFFYFGQDHRLADEAAVIRAVDGMTDWLSAAGYSNVLVEINNEADVYYDHPILRPTRVSELIARVKQRSGGRLKVSTSLGGGLIPSSTIVSASDFVLLHGNGRDATKIKSMVDQVRGMSAFKSSPKPIVFNEDSTTVANLDAAVSRRASWGYYDQGKNNYRDGFQSPPVNWKINTSHKQAFFDRVAYFTGGDSSSSPEASDLRVASFTLINADTNKPIAGFEAIQGGTLTLNLNELPTANLNVQANTSPSTVGSVIFSLNSTAKYRVENEAPYTLAGDSYPNYHAWTPGPGTYAIAATPYSRSNGGGTVGAALSLTLTLTDSAAPDTSPPVVSLSYNIDTGHGEVKATDQSPIVRVEVMLNGSKVATGSGVPFAFSTGVLSAGTYTLEARVTDSPGNVGTASTTFTISAPTSSPTAPVVKYRVNAGGAAVSSTPDWTPDTTSNPSKYVNVGVTGNDTYQTSKAINLSHASIPSGTPSSLFQSERFNKSSKAEMHWSFPVTPGTYEVRIYFAEIYFTSKGQRVFDVVVENTRVLSNYDIVADVGAFKGVVKSFVVSSDASLDIHLNRIRENPKVSAIEIIQR